MDSNYMLVLVCLFTYFIFKDYDINTCKIFM